MKVNRHAVAAVCAKAWGITPAQFWEYCRRGDVTFQQVVAQCRLEMLATPLSAEPFFEWLMPGAKKTQKQKEHQRSNSTTFEILKRKRDGGKTAGNSTT